ncbi:hypothetical protein BJ878DRAFT_326298 [Calycina marina]|uniref:Uncharacterized protein n=1 Tax=Calycina marina TaxID=1763456 RepID=A0A9P8CIU1_9HELO|nr:hypothetical protein BJ878DRAFT_326298 [Calycina marina]
MSQQGCFDLTCTMASRASEVLTSASVFRPVVPLPRDLATHLKICFEDILIQGITIFGDVTLCGTSHPNRLQTPAYKPEPILIEILTTLLIHPKYTTRALAEHKEIPQRSIHILRGLVESIGPLSIDLSIAYSLKSAEGRHARSGNDFDDESIDVKKVLGNRGRLKDNAKDFWQIVGWAFNCSVVHHRRWKYWKVWLDYMLDVLDADWDARERLDIEETGTSYGGDSFQAKSTRRSEALIVQYLSDVGRSTKLQTVVDSIFTDGGGHDMASYPEVFPNETLGASAVKKVEKQVNYTKGFGNLEEGDDDEMEFGIAALGDEELSCSQISQSTDDGEATPDHWLGGSESITLRQRIIIQLSRVSLYLPQNFVPIRTLYTCLTDAIKSLPVESFSLLMSGTSSTFLPDNVQVSLSGMLLARYLPKDAPNPRNFRKGQDNDDLNRDTLEKCYLPFAASTSSAEDNAKVSILVETAFRLCVKSGVIARRSPGLKTAVEKGIRAREFKVNSTKPKARGASKMQKRDDSPDKMWLKTSGLRIRAMLAFLEQAGS